MNLEKVDTVIGNLESALGGAGKALPSNTEIVAALAFLEKHIGQNDALSQRLAQRLSSETLRLDHELASGLRSLRERLGEQMSADEQLRVRVLYVPNRIPREERLSNAFFASVLFAYAGFALHVDDFFIPGKRSNGVHLHGTPVWIMFAATLCAVIVLMATIVDHYDTRPNERIYERLSKFFRGMGWTLFGAALVVDIALKWRH